MRYLGWIAGGIVMIVAVVFAIHNHQRQSLDLWPLPLVVDLPVYVLILAAIALGFCVGATAMWVSGGRWRRLARARLRENRALKREIEARVDQRPEAEPPAELPKITHAGGASSRRS